MSQMEIAHWIVYFKYKVLHELRYIKKQQNKKRINIVQIYDNILRALSYILDKTSANAKKCILK